MQPANRQSQSTPPYPRRSSGDRLTDDDAEPAAEPTPEPAQRRDCPTCRYDPPTGSAVRFFCFCTHPNWDGFFGADTLEPCRGWGAREEPTR